MFSIMGDTVLDPFLETGTTTAAAICSRKNSIGYELESMGWGVEVYHRGIKQCCGIDREGAGRDGKVTEGAHTSIAEGLPQPRGEQAGKGGKLVWYEAKFSIIRAAISSFLAHPTIGPLPTA
jgi:hypothetical protein